jgi:hypothetical protein
MTLISGLWSIRPAVVGRIKHVMTRKALSVEHICEPPGMGFAAVATGQGVSADGYVCRECDQHWRLVSWWKKDIEIKKGP